jgi:hypothetical protein
MTLVIGSVYTLYNHVQDVCPYQSRCAILRRWWIGKFPESRSKESPFLNCLYVVVKATPLCLFTANVKRIPKFLFLRMLYRNISQSRKKRHMKIFECLERTISRRIAQNPRDLSPEVTLDGKGYGEEVRVRPASSVKTIKVVL